jgi:hypothetical protein
MALDAAARDWRAGGAPAQLQIQMQIIRMASHLHRIECRGFGAGRVKMSHFMIQLSSDSGKT